MMLDLRESLPGMMSGSKNMNGLKARGSTLQTDQ